MIHPEIQAIIEQMTETVQRAMLESFKAGWDTAIREAQGRNPNEQTVSALRIRDKLATDHASIIDQLKDPLAVWAPGDRVTIIQPGDDRPTGAIDRIENNGLVIVNWDSGAIERCDPKELRPA